MKSFAIACAAVLLFAATASAGDKAVSKSTLGNMGLGSMQSMSDTDGMAVRGKGTFASVWGGSQASYLGNLSENHFESGAQWIGKGSSAGGESFSFAGKVELLYASDPTGSALQVSAIGGIAGGSAKAWAH